MFNFMFHFSGPQCSYIYLIKHCSRCCCENDFWMRLTCNLGFPGDTSGKDPCCQGGRCRRSRFNPWVGKIPWRGHGNPLQYSCLENPLDRGAWWAMIHRVAKSQRWLKRVSKQHINQWTLSKADYSSWCGWAPLNQLKVLIAKDWPFA